MKYGATMRVGNVHFKLYGYDTEQQVRDAADHCDAELVEIVMYEG